MNASSVSIGNAADPRRFTGTISSLDGTAIDARVASTDGQTLTLALALQITPAAAPPARSRWRSPSERPERRGDAAAPAQRRRRSTAWGCSSATWRSTAACLGPAELDGPALVELAERSGLRGRGGARFPAAIKMRAVRASRGRAIVVANGCESEPMSRKDALLLDELPHLVLDGAALAARAVGADRVIVAFERGASAARASLEHALAQRRAARIDAVPVRAVRGGRDLPHRPGDLARLADQRRAGQADLHPAAPDPARRSAPPDARAERRDARPPRADRPSRRRVVPRPGNRGRAGLDARDGDRRGQLTGRLRDRVRHTAGPSARRRGRCQRRDRRAARRRLLRIMAACLGAPRSSSCQTPASRAIDAALGCGVVVALPASACPVAETVRVAIYLATETANQCGPCVNGSAAIARTLYGCLRRHGGAGRAGRLGALDRGNSGSRRLPSAGRAGALRRDRDADLRRRLRRPRAPRPLRRLRQQAPAAHPATREA